MGASLNQPSRVRDDGPMDCKPLCREQGPPRVAEEERVPEEKASANSVPAAAVIRRIERYPDLVGCVGGEVNKYFRRTSTSRNIINIEFATGTAMFHTEPFYRRARLQIDMRKNYNASLFISQSFPACSAFLRRGYFNNFLHHACRSSRQLLNIRRAVAKHLNTDKYTAQQPIRKKHAFLILTEITRVRRAPARTQKRRNSYHEQALASLAVRKL